VRSGGPSGSESPVPSRSPSAPSTTDGLELLVLGDERPVAVLPAGHRLAARSSLAMADLRSLPEFSDVLPHEPLDAIVDRVARLVLAWPAGQARALRAELIRMAQGLAQRDRLAPVVQGAGAGAPSAAPRE
jgi:hypothetical protein